MSKHVTSNNVPAATMQYPLKLATDRGPRPFRWSVASRRSSCSCRCWFVFWSWSLEWNSPPERKDHQSFSLLCFWPFESESVLILWCFSWTQSWPLHVNAPKWISVGLSWLNLILRALGWLPHKISAHSTKLYCSSSHTLLQQCTVD